MIATPDLQRTFSGSIPLNYDEFLGPAWFGAFATDLAARLPPDPGGDVLELACGTGLTTRCLRERLDGSRRLVATDLSESMLDYARLKLAGLGGIEWQLADAAQLPFGDGEFGAVACSFGVMYVPDRRALFAEARRVLRHGGLLLFNVWDRIEENGCMRIYAEVIEAMFPGDTRLQFRLPYEMYDQDLLRAWLEGGGFVVKKLEKTRLPVRTTARNVATGQVRGTPRGLLLAERGVELDVAIAKVAAALQQAGGNGADFRLHCQAIVVEAVAT